MTRRLLTARQVAERLGVVPATVLRWTRNGELPAHRMPGGAIRYDEDELAAWLAANATGATVRGVSTARAGRAQIEGYAANALRSVSSTARPPHDEAARTEEDLDAR